MKLSDAIKQLRKGYNLTNFQQAELLESLSNNNSNGDSTDSVRVLNLDINDDGDLDDVKWEDLQKVDTIRMGEEGISIILIKALGDKNILSFYGQVNDTSFIKFTFSNVDGKAKLHEPIFDNFRKIDDTIHGVGDSDTALSTYGANNLLKRKADLVNGLVPAAQLPSYVDDVVDLNGFTPNIIDVAEEDAILNYPANTKWVCTATVEPFKSKYNKKILHVNANTSKEDWTIVDPEKDKIYIIIGADGNAVNGDTFRWSGTTWINLNQNLNNKIDALNNNALFYGDYTSAGGSLSKSELSLWLADASSTHVVVVPETQLGNIVTDDSLKAKLDNAGILIIEKSNNYQIILRSVGYNVNNIHSFVGSTTSTSFQQVNYNILTGELSQIVNMHNTAYSEYLNIGGTIPEVTFNNWYTSSPSSTLFIDRSNIGVTLEESKDALIKGSSTIVVRDVSGSKSSVSFLRTSTENDNYIWYGWLNSSTVERLSYDASTRKFTIANIQIGKDSLDSRIMNLPYSQLGTTVSSVAGQGIKRSSAIILTTTDTNSQYSNVMFTRASTSATEIKFVNPTISEGSYTIEYITYNPETRSLSSINV